MFDDEICLNCFAKSLHKSDPCIFFPFSLITKLTGKCCYLWSLYSNHFWFELFSSWIDVLRIYLCIGDCPPCSPMHSTNIILCSVLICTQEDAFIVLVCVNMCTMSCACLSNLALLHSCQLSINVICLVSSKIWTYMYTKKHFLLASK